MNQKTIKNKCICIASEIRSGWTLIGMDPIVGETYYYQITNSGAYYIEQFGMSLNSYNFSLFFKDLVEHRNDLIENIVKEK